MRYIGLLYRDRERLTAQSPDPILLTSTDASRFANTFVSMSTSGNIADHIDGRRSNGDSCELNNYTCWDWLDLSVADRRVYDRCREMNLRRTNGAQWDLFNAGTHAALLYFKR